MELLQYCGMLVSGKVRTCEFVIVQGEGFEMEVQEHIGENACDVIGSQIDGCYYRFDTGECR